MELTRFGSTELFVSRLGLGTVKFGRNQQVKYPTAFELPSDKQIRNLLALCRELGINLIDTAPAYGSSETRLGHFLPAPRDKWVIMSKAGENFVNGESSYDFGPRALERSVKQSLQHLGCDYLDIVLIHSDGNDLQIINELGALDTLNRLKQQGLIRATGMSTKTLAGGLLALEHSDAVMVTYHPGYTDELPILQRAQALGKAVLIKKALLSGHLHKLNQRDPVQACFDFILQQAAVTSIITGTLNPEHLRHNAQCCQRALRYLAHS